MTEREILQILLVRSIEESDRNYFAPDVQLDALIVSGTEEDDAALVQKRARYLFQKLPDTLKEIPRTLHLPRTWAVVLCAAVFFLGIACNYLGPGDRVHVIYNPVVLLILWNICIFAVFLLRHFFRKDGEGPAEAPRQAEAVQPGTEEAGHRAPAGPGYTSSASLRVFRQIWFFLHRQLSKKKGGVTDLPSRVRMSLRYMELWWEMNQHMFFSQFTRFVHVLAVCLITGALFGIYMRGLFFEYNVIWKSTFIHDAHDIALILNALFGLPSQLLHGAFIDEAGIEMLLSPGGEPAAPWIHLFAVSAFLFVVPQRLLLMFLESWRLRSLSGQLTIDPDEPYYAGCVRRARDMQAHRLRKEIAVVVQAGVSNLSGSVAVYARDKFYDENVVPQFMHFRNNGGRISDLEEHILQQSEDFKEGLDRFLDTAREDFSRSVAEGVSRVIGKKLSVMNVPVNDEIRIKPGIYREAFDGTVTKRLTGGISLAVTAAVAAAIGTLSGGFGKVLGIAVVTTLLHTTGPVGFIIGAVAGLLLGGSASILAKDKITGAVKNQSFPGFSTRLLLRESKMNRLIEEGRTQVYTLIKKQIEDKMMPHADEITDRILSQISSVREEQS